MLTAYLLDVMKISTKNYAAGLIESLNEKADLKVAAKRFWQILQKNKQYKELPKILVELDVEYAKRNNLVLAYIYSEKALAEQELENLRQKLKQKTGQDSIVKNIVNPNLKAGILVKVDSREIDLSVEGKLTRLKKVLTK
jgi:ATP synthase F1 delta subunit